eukprot:scaffold4786_cov104-Isochrysis_galbana.AAC.5
MLVVPHYREKIRPQAARPLLIYNHTETESYHPPSKDAAVMMGGNQPVAHSASTMRSTGSVASSLRQPSGASRAPCASHAGHT